MENYQAHRAERGVGNHSRGALRVGWFAVAAALAAALAWPGADAAAQGFGQGPTRVLVERAEQRVVPVTLQVVGSVEPQTRSVIASEIAGLVVSVEVEEGDSVERGAVLCRLRDATHRLEYAQAQARLAQLQAELAELEAGTRAEEIEQARAMMQEAQAIAEKWERELERVEQLRARNSASLKEYNDTVADTLAARQRLAQAKAAYELAVAGPRKEHIDQARFAVEAHRSLAARLADNLDRTVIRAPFAGHVTRKHAEVGQWITAGGAVVEMIDLEKVRVRADVPESAIEACRVGAPVSVFVEALQETFTGPIGYVTPQADPRARTFPIQVVVDNPYQRLKSGMFVRARVPAGPTEESLVVPRDAVLYRDGSAFVVAVLPMPEGDDGQMAVPMAVALGAEVGDWVAVRAADLAPGIPVAVKGHDRIFGPQPVAASPREAAAGPASTHPAAAGDDSPLTPATHAAP